MSEEIPAPQPGETITPEKAWELLCATYLNTARASLPHLKVCPNREAKLEFQKNVVGQCRFRVVCPNCNAYQILPFEPNWFSAWELVTAGDSKIIALPG